MVTMPESSQHGGSSNSNCATPRSSRKRSSLEKILEMAATPIKFEITKEEQSLNLVKRQWCESETYSRLHQEYGDLYASISNNSIPPYLKSLNQSPLNRIEKQMKELGTSAEQCSGSSRSYFTLDAPLVAPTSGTNSMHENEDDGNEIPSIIWWSAQIW